LAAKVSSFFTLPEALATRSKSPLRLCFSSICCSTYCIPMVSTEPAFCIRGFVYCQKL